MAANVAGYRDEGYTKFQLKVGADADSDIERIRLSAAEMARATSSLLTQIPDGQCTRQPGL